MSDLPELTRELVPSSLGDEILITGLGARFEEMRNDERPLRLVTRARELLKKDSLMHLSGASFGKRTILDEPQADEERLPQSETVRREPMKILRTRPVFSYTGSRPNIIATGNTHEPRGPC